MIVRSQSLSELFYTTDTYGTFNSDMLNDSWFEESEFDSEGFMKDLAELHADVINGVLPAGGIKSVKVISTSSPREYNFQTDQVELYIDVDLRELYRYLQMHNNAAEFEEFIKDRFTSRDGFWSWTPNTLQDFYETMDGVSVEYSRDTYRDKCITILAGWYLTRECLTKEEYMDEMYDKVNEISWEHFEQFTTETWDEYNKYEEEFNRLKGQTEMSFEGFPPGVKYLMDIEEWYKDREERKEKVDA